MPGMLFLEFLMAVARRERRARYTKTSAARQLYSGERWRVLRRQAVCVDCSKSSLGKHLIQLVRWKLISMMPAIVVCIRCSAICLGNMAITWANICTAIANHSIRIHIYTVLRFEGVS